MQLPFSAPFFPSYIWRFLFFILPSFLTTTAYQEALPLGKVFKAKALSSVPIPRFASLHVD